MLALSLWRLGRAGEAYRLLEESRTSERDDDLHLLGMRGWLRFAEDDLENARADLEAAAASELRLGALLVSSVHLTVLARVQYAMRRLGATRSSPRSRRWRSCPRPSIRTRAFVWWSVIVVPAARGDWATADAYAARAAAEPRDPVDRRVAVGMALALVASARGDHEAVLAALEPVAELSPNPAVDEPGFWPWQDLYAEALVATGRAEEADRFLRAARAARRPPRPPVDDRAARARARARRGGARPARAGGGRVRARARAHRAARACPTSAR